MWYYIKSSIAGDETVGPLDEPEFLVRIRKKQVVRNTLVMNPEHTDGHWKNATDVTFIINAIDRFSQEKRDFEKQRAIAETARRERIKQERPPVKIPAAFLEFWRGDRQREMGIMPTEQRRKYSMFAVLQAFFLLAGVGSIALGILSLVSNTEAGIYFALSMVPSALLSFLLISLLDWLQDVADHLFDIKVELRKLNR